MKNSCQALSFLIACTLAASATCSASDDFFSTLAREHPKIKWDKSSLIVADFNGDKITDNATLGYKGKQVIIGIAMGHMKDAKPQLLPFGIGEGMQDAICALPAKLTSDPLVCNSGDGPLPGCKQLAGARDLSLSGGECDSIHLYWNHRAKRMEWWRL